MNKKNLFNWREKTSEHYIFSFLSNSVAEKEIEDIIREQEKWYSLIIKKLKIKNNRKIHYYLYPSRTLKEKLTEDVGNAYANWDDFSVHTIYSKNLKVIGPHEDTHLLTLSWGTSIELFQEGLAEYLHPLWHSKSHNYWVKKYKEENKFEFEKLFDNNYFYSLNPNISYPIAGSFTKFLIDKYGLEKFKESYSSLSKEKNNKENIEIFENIYQKPIREIESDWIK